MCFFFCGYDIWGSFRAGVPPLPIPNRAVKSGTADGTTHQSGRVGSCHFLELEFWFLVSVFPVEGGDFFYACGTGGDGCFSWLYFLTWYVLLRAEQNSPASHFLCLHGMWHSSYTKYNCTRWIRREATRHFFLWDNEKNASETNKLSLFIPLALNCLIYLERVNIRPRWSMYSFVVINDIR